MVQFLRPLVLAGLGAGVLAAQALPTARQFTTVVPLETTAEDSANVSMGDLDGDGDLDLVLAKGRHTPIRDRVLLNDGTGRFTASDLGPVADRTYTAALADLDADGDLDVVTSNDQPDRKLVFLNDGKGTFTAVGSWGVGEWSTRNCALADLNSDGKVDVVAANRPGPSYVCLGEGGGRFASPCLAIPADSATTIVPADVDRDGAVDLAVPARDRGQSHIYYNDGHAGFGRRVAFGPATAAGRAAAAADFDGDGWIDLAVGDEAAASLVVYLNDRKGGLAAGFSVTDRAHVPYAMAAGDLDRDGRPDIVLGYTTGPHAIFFNDGTGRAFRRETLGDAEGSAYGFALGDVDHDGWPDIALARSGAPNVLFLSRPDVSSAADVRAVALGIVDADNRRDLAGVLRFYAEDATLLPPNDAPVHGAAAIRPRYERLFAEFAPAIEGHVDDVSVEGSLAVVRGRNGGRLVPRGPGTPRVLSDAWLMVLRKGADGAWRITQLMWHPAPASGGQ